METKNEILHNYGETVLNMATDLFNYLNTLTPNNSDVNSALIRTIDIQMTALNSQLVTLQTALDSYGV